MSICAVEQLFDIYSSHIPIMFPKKQKFQQGRRVGLSNPKILVLLLFQKYYFTFFRDSWTGMTDNSGQERWILSHTHTNTHTHTHTHTDTYISVDYGPHPPLFISEFHSHQAVAFVVTLCAINASITIINFSYLKDLLVFSGYFPFWFLIVNIWSNKSTILGKVPKKS